MPGSNVPPVSQETTLYIVFGKTLYFSAYVAMRAFADDSLVDVAKITGSGSGSGAAISTGGVSGIIGWLSAAT